MIIDNIKNINFYEGVLPGLKAGYEAVSKMVEAGLEDGRYEFDGGFFLIQTGQTKPMEEGNFEAHQKYVDIQILLEGSEEIAWANLEDLQEEIAYNPDKDALYLSGDTSYNMLVERGMFYIAFPHDGHRPVRHTKDQQSFKKIVMKLPA